MRVPIERLYEIWAETGRAVGGVFQSISSHNQSRRLVDDEAEQGTSVPNEDGPERGLYWRKPGQPREIANGVTALVSRHGGRGLVALARLYLFRVSLDQVGHAYAMLLQQQPHARHQRWILRDDHGAVCGEPLQQVPVVQDRR